MARITILGIFSVVFLLSSSEAGAQACNPQYPATCVQVFNPNQRSYQPPTIPLYVPPPAPPQTWLQPVQPWTSGTTRYTDQYGNTIGYEYKSGSTTTYTDAYGNIIGYGQ